eukprot:tig00000383_g24725.t1
MEAFVGLAALSRCTGVARSSSLAPHATRPAVCRAARPAFFGTRARAAAHSSSFYGAPIALPRFLHSSRPAQAYVPPRSKYKIPLTFPPLPDVKFPPYERIALPNGLVIFVIEDKELPLVNGAAYFKAGGRWDAPEKTGLADLAGIVMRSGGSKSVPAGEFDRILENRAAVVESGADRSMFSVGFNSLTDDLDEVLRLFASLLREPAFPEDKLELARLQFEAAIARRNDDPGGIVGREFGRLVYGEDCPWVRMAEYATVRSVTTADLHAYHARYFHPNNCVLGIVGNVTADQVRELTAKHFGGWPAARKLSLPGEAVVKQARGGEIHLVDRPDMNQAFVQFGQLGGTVRDPDYFNLCMLNGVMNGFGGRLFNEVRSRQGLAYSVYGYWNAQFDHPGVFTAGGETGADVATFIEGMRAVLEELRTKEPTPEEVEYARESTLNSFVFNFASPETVLVRLLRYEFYQYPFDYIFQFKRGIEAATGADILRVAKQRLDPSNFVYCVVGNAAELRPSLEKLGMPVIDRPIPIPQ